MNKNVIRTFLLTLGAISAGLLLIAGIGGYFITGPAPIDDWPNWVKPTDEATTILDDKIAALEQEIDEAATGEELTLKLTEEEATSKLDRLARDGELSVEMEYIQIHFSDGIVWAFARVDMGIDVQVAIQANIGVEDGKPDITIKRLNLGRIPIPKALINSVMTALEQAMTDRWEDLTVSLQDVTTEHGEIAITLVKK
ncbi:MAG: hypothetical protein AMJ37_01015 [Dehalococcoidia bacterium DG_18]|nr:MAG: hypothetical protein AMJ37_01015 [Dehalococcoidia bacterium DG_18]